MDSQDLLQYLGSSPSEGGFDSFLEAHRIYDRPHLPEDDDEYEEDSLLAYDNARESMIDEVERYSIALIYEDRIHYERLRGPLDTDRPFVLDQVAFYAPGIRRYRGFPGSLPLGLAFGDDKATVHEKLGNPVCSRAIHGMQADLYITTQLKLNISYDDDGRIGIIHASRPHLYDRRMMGWVDVDRDPVAPDLRRLMGLLGRNAYDSELEAVLEPMGFKASQYDMSGVGEISELIPGHGIALYYRDSDEIEDAASQPAGEPEPLFAGFRINRKGDAASAGYDGGLPLGLEFHHTPGQLRALVGKEPEWTSIGDDIGASQWILPDCILHVMFSLIDYQVYRVSYFARFMEKELFKQH